MMIVYAFVGVGSKSKVSMSSRIFSIPIFHNYCFLNTVFSFIALKPSEDFIFRMIFMKIETIFW